MHAKRCRVKLRWRNLRHLLFLSLAPFVAWLEDAGVPGLILGVDGAEPPPADAAVETCGRGARLIHRRNGLTRPLEVPGFCLIHLLQHNSLLSRAVYTCQVRGGVL